MNEISGFSNDYFGYYNSMINYPILVMVNRQSLAKTIAVNGVWCEEFWRTLSIFLCEDACVWNDGFGEGGKINLFSKNIYSIVLQ